MQTRGNRPNYLALNDGYQDEVRPGDWTSSLAWSPAAQGPEGPVPSSHNLPVVNQHLVPIPIPFLKLSMTFYLRNPPLSYLPQPVVRKALS
jgi:hypothetical protein